MSRDYIQFSVNGKLHKFRGQQAFLPLSDLLRYELAKTGTKVVCAEGDCGACTVMCRRDQSRSEKFQSLNSCIKAGILLDGCQIITVEGLEKNGALSEVQESMVRNFGGQCGFCTPGFVMSMTNMYENTEGKITEQKVKNFLTGNLCRCTGYSPIIQAAMDVDRSKLKPMKDQFNTAEIDKALKEDRSKSIFIEWNGKEFFAPVSLAEAAEYKKKHKNARIFSGATDIGVQINKGRDPGSHLMSLHLIKELYEIKEDAESIQVGAKTSLYELEKFVADKAPEFANFLHIFASPQIKNVATLVGNIANGSPIADTTPYLLTADAEVDLYSVNGIRSLPLVEFIQGYKKFDLKDDEIISHIRFKKLDKDAKVGLYKVSQRRDLDISCVNSSFIFVADKGKIKKARIALGGVGPKTIRLSQLEKHIEGKEINEALSSEVKKMIIDEITPLSDVRGTAEFRKNISLGLYEKFIKENF